MIARIEAFERDIVNYFKSRNEDKNVRNIASQSLPPNKQKPFTPAQPKPIPTGGLKPTVIPSSHFRGVSRPRIRSSGPAGTHEDDDEPYQNVSDHEQNNNCHQDDDDHHHHCHQDEHDHHHHHHQNNHDHDHHHHHDHHEDCSNTDNSAYNNDNTNYGGPGSFY